MTPIRKARHRTMALAALLAAWPMATAIAAEDANPRAAPRTGRLFLSTNGADTYAEFDLRSGKLTPLPVSPLSRRRGPDHWHGSAFTGAFVRTDPYGSLAFLEPRRFVQIGQADLSPFAGTGDRPRFSANVRVSPDGQFLLGYWWLRADSPRPRLFVKMLNGQAVDEDSPLDYDRDAYSEAVDWLPDGRYVYLAGDELVFAKPRAGIQQRLPLRLPEGIRSAGAELRVSPDGRRGLLTLNTPVGRINFRSLYTVGLEDGVVRPLTRPAPEVVRLGVAQHVMGATWSPDGQWVAFLTRGVNPGMGVAGAMPMCQSVRVVPADGSISSVNYDRADHFSIPDPRTRDRPLLGCASDELNWLP
ncbi:TolB family protein [Roseateles chitosanitabidus]|uniref:TolB family protein n=1 Tax=Roseateles chitosanitabidus TaxID=65048 RepID=UPI0011DFB231|nr:PD40 domain-containing protein [Roseateles chitosanitabidus]